jgi:NitT/TauT family transport system substrate-binding protein
VTTQLIVTTKFLKDHPDVVKKLVEGQIQANDYVNIYGPDAQTAVNAGIEKATGKSLKPEIIAAAWKNLTFTDDPIAASLKASAEHAESVGLLEKVDLTGIYDLSILNSLLKAAGEPEVSDS